MKEEIVIQRKVTAEPMTRIEYNVLRGWELPADEDGNDLGYKLTTLDGAHISWSPKSIVDSETVKEEKTLGNTCAKGATKNVKDIVFWGSGDTFKLISKASSQKEGWMKSSKFMKAGSGGVLQVTTQQRNPDGGYAVAEAVTFVPNVKLEEVKEDGVVVSRVLIAN